MSYSVRAEIPEEIQKELGKYPELLQKLLYYRGITTGKAAETFLNPVFEENYNPFQFKGMDIAVERILKAIENNEKTIIYSDYDADGIPGAVVLHDFFKKIGYTNFENYIPHRVLEGFGLNDDAIDEFAKKKVDLIITIDCGIADVEVAETIKKHKIDLIITDHHLPRMDESGEELLPHALAVIDHKQKDCGYPDKNICGSGTIFKVVQALIQKNGAAWNIKDGWEKWLLDMVGIATVSDMVPLVGENRIFAYYGLKVLRKSPRLGLQRLLSLIKVDQKNITEDDIGFMISPRINAASRMGVPEDAFHMLTADTEEEADKYARHLDEINNERKGVVAAMVKEIKKHWKEIDPEKKRKVLVAGNPDWKPSLLGLVANSLMDEHIGPIFLWGREEGKTLKGSCRSDGCVNIVEMMREAKDVFVEYGGHLMAGGFSVKFEKVDVLADALEVSYQKLSVSGDREGVVADASLTIDDVNYNLEKQVMGLAPFGMDNPKPIFLFKGIEIHESSIFGKQKNHLKVDFKNKKGQIISAIAFFKKPEDYSRKIDKGDKIDLLANLEKSFFRGRGELRLRIVDIF
jgi:single-stranded-DNA-specific exonuclease